MQVRVWGMTASGEPFIQNASADIAGPQRVSIAGIEHPVPVGETLGVEYQGRRGRFSVVGAGQAGTPEAGKIEIRPLDDVQNFWGINSEQADGRYRFGRAAGCATLPLQRLDFHTPAGTPWSYFRIGDGYQFEWVLRRADGDLSRRDQTFFVDERRINLNPLYRRSSHLSSRRRHGDEIRGDQRERSCRSGPADRQACSSVVANSIPNINFMWRKRTTPGSPSRRNARRPQRSSYLQWGRNSTRMPFVMITPKHELLVWALALPVAFAIWLFGDTGYANASTYWYGLVFLALVAVLFWMRFRQQPINPSKSLRIISGIVLAIVSVICGLYLLGVATWYK